MLDFPDRRSHSLRHLAFDARVPRLLRTPIGQGMIASRMNWRRPEQKPFCGSLEAWAIRALRLPPELLPLQVRLAFKAVNICQSLLSGSVAHACRSPLAVTPHHQDGHTIDAWVRVRCHACRLHTISLRLFTRHTRPWALDLRPH